MRYVVNFPEHFVMYNNHNCSEKAKCFQVHVYIGRYGVLCEGMHDLENVKTTLGTRQNLLQSWTIKTPFFAESCRNDKSISSYQQARPGDMTNFVCRPNRKPNVTGNGALCVCSHSPIDKILIKTDIKWRPFSFADSSRMRNSTLIMTANTLVSFRLLPCNESVVDW